MNFIEQYRADGSSTRMDALIGSIILDQMIKHAEAKAYAQRLVYRLQLMDLPMRIPKRFKRLLHA